MRGFNSCRWELLLLLFAGLFWPQWLGAQSLDTVAPATSTFALENVKIVQQPGQVIPNGTIVIKNGLIEAVGVDVEIPFDAERIQGDSLVVYAGFIDGLSHTGIPEPKNDNNGGGGSGGGSQVNRANPPNDQAGIQPERPAYDLVDASDKSIAELRNVGFTAAHVVPYGQMLPGKGAIILLAGDKTDDMVLQRDVSLFAQLTGARGVYPATAMGVTAKMRQLFREASRRMQVETLYASNSTDMPRPEYDAAHYALFPVIKGDMPVVMHTSDPLDIYRALSLKQSLGYPLILSGLYGGFESIDLLLDANVPLFLTLKLPEEKKADEKKEGAKKDSSASATGEDTKLPAAYDPRLHVTDHTSTDTERINLEARKQIFYNEYVATAATMYESGLNFGFTTKDVKAGDIHKNLLKMIELGLSKDVALAALTTIPARTLGLSRSMGSVEKGKIANLVVTRGDLFETTTKIKYVFVDGEKFEIEEKK